jgi:hypothetical protein
MFGLLKKRETVADETPAMDATSSSFGILPLSLIAPR